jgi:tRNA threonylcarbamoyladenosine biosynthesis protein TsaE
MLRAGDIVLLYGPLGAGKTTLVRGLMGALGESTVRSPTFNLIQTFPTSPPVMHADLYRLASAHGLGLEDYFESHLCLIEWPERLGDLIEPDQCYRLRLDFTSAGRDATLLAPHEIDGDARGV